MERDSSTLLFGYRGSETAEKFWYKQKHHVMNYIASDYWQPYEDIIPAAKHIQLKNETFTV